MTGSIGARSRPPEDPAAVSSAARARRFEHRYSIAASAWDTFRRRRLHPAFGGGVLALVGLENVLAGPIAGSAAWTKFAERLVS